MSLRLLLFVFSILFLSSVAIAQTVTTIANVQDTTGGAGNGDSHLNGQVVTLSGIVTAEHRGDNSANGGISDYYFFMMDSAGAWSGIKVISSDSITAEGDSITITGTVEENYGQTQIDDLTSFVRHSSRHTIPGPLVVTTGEVSNSEAYESCLVRISNADITETGIGSYNNWIVDDGSGSVKIDTRAKYYFSPEVGDSLKSLTGIVLYGYGEFTVAPRLAWDVVEGGEFTRIQRIQQVRNSDLLRAFNDSQSDISYALNDTFKITGVVTMPTGLSYAGAGLKFILSEIDGGPWSSILSYHADSTAMPVLYEGDIVEMYGYVFEYTTGPANMTEFFILGSIDITNFAQPIPEPDFVTTGDLRLPVTAEQWGNSFVYVKDAEVVNYTGFELFGVNDESGTVLVDDDSDSVDTYYESNPLPPLGTIADSIRGWVYHHYGSYDDSSAYKLEPLYMWDIVWGGGGPPVISNVIRDVGVPTSSDIVTVSAEVTTALTLTDISFYYQVNNGGYTQASMSNTTGDIYEAQIPVQSEGSWVDYYLTATDNQTQATSFPADLTKSNLCYPVTDGNLDIETIQYTPWQLGDSPFDGYKVEVTGIVTVDTNANNNYDAYIIQDAEAPWGGIFVFGINADLTRGDQITAYGTVTDYNDDYHFQWDNATVVLTDSFKVLSSGNSVNPIDITTAELADSSADVESYEGVHVKISKATLISVNKYDLSFDDGSGPCLVDGDFLTADDEKPNNTFYINQDDGYLMAFGDTIRPGDQIDMIQGIFIWGYGSYKLGVRGPNDFGNVTGINPDYKAIAYSYQLRQNFPNPFNPETRIYFEIPASQNVKIAIYNVLGQKVRTLVNKGFSAGTHIVNWNGLNDFGARLSTGIYVYRIKAGKFIDSKKMLMIK